METSNPKSDYNFSMVSLNVYLLDCFGMKLVYRSCAAGLWKCDSIALLWDRPASWHPCRTISSSGRTKNRICTPFFRSIHSLMLLASIFSVTSSRDNSFRSSYVADIYWDSWVISLYKQLFFGRTSWFVLRRQNTPFSHVDWYWFGSIWTPIGSLNTTPF